MRQALGAGLDDFTRIAVDSTAVEAASAWPTDSKTIVDLCARFLVREKQLSAFGYRHGSMGKAQKWLEQLSGLHKGISMAGNGANAQRKRRKLYQEFFVTSCKLIEHLLQRYRLSLLWNESVQLPPRQREHLNLLLQVLGEDVHDAASTLHHAIDRVQLGRCAKMRDRVLGIADRAASIIIKGGREPVMGYKPQIARSTSGFVTAIIVESGNPSDSGKLDELVRESQRVTSVMPSEVSADDGYASANGLNGLYTLGVTEVSISGAKGKRLLGELWELPVQQQLRGWRSSIESLMFVLKHSYRFGKLGRRGLDAVRREMTEKAIAYNFDRILLLRSHAKHDPAAPAVAAEPQHPPPQVLAA